VIIESEMEKFVSNPCKLSAAADCVQEQVAGRERDLSGEVPSAARGGLARESPQRPMTSGIAP
jgi:hypothetical protein